MSQKTCIPKLVDISKQPVGWLLGRVAAFTGTSVFEDDVTTLVARFERPRSGLPHAA